MRLLRFLAKHPAPVFFLALVVVIAGASIRGYFMSDQTTIVACSPGWALPGQWQETGKVQVAADGRLQVTSGDLIASTTTVTAIASALSVRIKKIRDSEDIIVTNVGLSRIGFTFAGINSDICHQELGVSELAKFTAIADGRHITLYELP